jgi:hypothetical protein
MTRRRAAVSVSNPSLEPSVITSTDGTSRDSDGQDTLFRMRALGEPFNYDLAGSLGHQRLGILDFCGATHMADALRDNEMLRLMDF